MRNITVFNNRLDESNGTVENVLELKAKKTPWHLCFAGSILRKIGSARTAGGADKDGILAEIAKGIVSFLQNFLPSQTQKEGVCPAQKAFCRNGFRIYGRP